MNSLIFKIILVITIIITTLDADESVNKKSKITYEFFRNATAKLVYGPENQKQTFLLDPMFSKKGELPSFAGIEKNPTVDLPVDKGPAYIVKNIDAVIVSHLHADHFDSAAIKVIDKSIPIITPYNRSPIDKSDPMHNGELFSHQIEGVGFKNVISIGSETSNSITYKGTEIIQVFGLHGVGQLKQYMGGVNGIIFRAPNQPTIYWTGDTILDQEGRIEAVLKEYKPDVVIAHTGGALIKELSFNPLLMDQQQAIEIIHMAKKYNPNSVVIAIHMNSLDHCFTTKENLQKAVNELDYQINKDIIIPADGALIILEKPDTNR